MFLNGGFYFLIIVVFISISGITAGCSDCTNYGGCLSTATDGTCTKCACPQGFTGDCCENDAPAVCGSNPCNSNSSWHFTCTDFPHGLYQCTCQPGYTGANCDTTINGCNPNPCVNSKSCTSGSNGGFTCKCKSSYQGEYCQTYQYCGLLFNCGCNPNSNPCKNGGTCMEQGSGNFFCMCPYGYTGTTCQNQPCGSNPCQHGGQCIVTSSSGTTQCICPNIWGGQNCTDLKPCNAMPCENGGTCVDNGGGTTTCSCISGTTGTYCENIVDYCDPNPCWYPLNGQNYSVNCTSFLGGYSCNCPAGTTDQNCSTNPDNCVVDGQNVCKSIDAGANCTDGLDSYTCTCSPEYTGTNCDTARDFCDPNPCWYPLNGENISVTCESFFGGYTCDCPTGTTSPNCSINIDDCTVDEQNVCTSVDTAANCTDGLESYTCTCSPVYTGTNCENARDFCDPNPCWYPLNGQNISVNCTSFFGGHSCDCPAGTTDENCNTNIDDCTVDGQNVCASIDTTANCTDGLESYTCTCDVGYTGTNCETIINYCDPNPCWYPLDGQNFTANCTGHVGGYTCDCPTGTTGQNCSTNPDDCIADGENVCTSVDTNATCTDGLDSYTCTCDPEYTGQNCETVRDFCDPNPCWYPLNGENISVTCESFFGGYTCECPAGTTGEDCHTNPDDCIADGENICTSVDTNATCTDGLDNYTCSCDFEYTGKNCETVIDFCDPNPCWYPLNGENISVTSGTTNENCSTNIDDCHPGGNNVCASVDTTANCTDGLNSYTCTCDPAYTGTNCENIRNFCDPNPCWYPLNGETFIVNCTGYFGDYTCDCPAGTTDKNCSTNPDDCTVNGQNVCTSVDTSATCTDGLDSYTCTCDREYTGTNCETVINFCDPNPCWYPLDGANYSAPCDQFFGGYTCECPAGTTGQNCSINPDDCVVNGQNVCTSVDAGATCTDGLDAYTCTCDREYTGTNCETVIDFCDPNPCWYPLNGQNISVPCNSFFGDYSCDCPVGTTNKNCSTNIDDCHSNGNNVCGSIDTTATCTDGLNSYTCTCDPAYTGTNCETVINFCEPNPCWYPLNGQNYSVNCTHFLGGYSCNCPAGTTGKNCSTNPDNCVSNGHNVCTSVDKTATCTDGLNAYTCQCDPQYTGTNCQTVINFCQPNPCWYPLNGQNHTVDCTSFFGGYSCNCPAGTTGQNCSTNPNDCIFNGTNVCTSVDTNAVCIDGLNSYTCNCDPEYSGTNCDQVRNFCDPNPCYYPLNGTNVTVTCDSFFGGYSCECPVGTTNQNCSINIDDCNVNGQNVCKRNDSQANCTDNLNSFTCSCTRNYTGPTCEEMTNFCEPNPCWYPLHGSNVSVSCTPILGDYICNCPVGTTGKNCSTNLNDCIVSGKNPCNQTDSSATCIDGLNSYQCSCGPAYTGSDCSMSMIVWNVVKLFGGSDALISLMEQIVSQPSLIKSMMPFLLGQMPIANQSAMSWEYDDLFVWASYEKTELKSNDVVKWFDTTLGNCFTFNHQNSPQSYKLRQAGAQGGFRALMRVRQDEYLSWYDTAALLVFIHTSDQTVFSESLRYQIAPNNSGTVITKKITYSRLDGKYGTCVNDISQINNYYYSGNYTTDGCLSACYQDAVQAICGCMDPRYAMPEDATPCSIDGWDCVNNVTVVKGDPSNWESCFCPSPCHESQYESGWTSTAFVGSDVYCNSINDHSSSNKYKYCMSNYTDMAYVNVYVPRLSLQVFQETPAMTFNQFIGYTGGMIGMFIGVSIISFIDFVVLFFALGNSMCFKGERLYDIE